MKPRTERESHIGIQTENAMRKDSQAETGLPFLEILLLDARYALRLLTKSPAFTAVTVLTLMLGIGANVVVFGVLNAVLLRPLAVSDPGRLYQLRHQQWMSFRLLTHSYPAFEDLRQRNTTFSEMAAVNAYARAELSYRGKAVRGIAGDWVTGNYFDLLGVQPQLGRFFHQADEHGANSAPYLVLSNALWRTAFHADPGVVGTTVELDQSPFTVVGVAPEHFHGTERFVWPDYWIPITNGGPGEPASDELHSRTLINVTVIGRIKPGVTPQQASENLNAIAAQLAKEYPQTDDGQPLRLIHPGLFGDEGDVIRKCLWSVTILALLVLAAACANLASLFAARTADRSHELALRVALGSSAGRLVRQLLTEAVVLSMLGGAAGLAVAYLLLGVLDRWQSPYGHLEISVDVRVYLVALAFTLGSALFFGLAPARQAWRSSPLQAIKNGPMESLPLRRFALRDLLLDAQIAICTLLVTASLVAVRGMVAELRAPLGIKPQGAMLVNLDLSRDVDPGDAAIQKQRAILDAVHSIPGVTAVGVVSRTPMQGGMHGVPIFSPGTTDFNLKNSVLAPYVFPMSPGYLDAAGTRLLSGRDVAWQDTAKTPYVAIVNQIFARKMWGQTPAVGKHFILKGHLTEVVGVAEDGKYHDLQESPQPVVYPPFAQSEPNEWVFVVRSPRPPNEMAAALQRTLSSSEPDLAISVQSWPDALADEFFSARAATVGLGILGLLAAMLAVTGIFGMAAYSVSRRMKELGIRMALGAGKIQVLRAAVGRPMVVLGVGSVVGLLAGLFASRLLGQIVYQANPQDPVVAGGTVLMMVLLGIAASAIPARRALDADPSRLMREE
jgi:predicted permease